MMKQVEVTIMGQGYILGCPEGGEALLAILAVANFIISSTLAESWIARARGAKGQGCGRAQQWAEVWQAMRQTEPLFGVNLGCK